MRNKKTIQFVLQYYNLFEIISVMLVGVFSLGKISVHALMKNCIEQNSKESPTKTLTLQVFPNSNTAKVEMKK